MPTVASASLTVFARVATLPSNWHSCELVDLHVATATSAVPAGRSPPDRSTRRLLTSFRCQHRERPSTEMLTTFCFDLYRLGFASYALTWDSGASSYATSLSGFRGCRGFRPNTDSVTSLKIVCRFSVTTFSHASFPSIGK